MTAFSEFKFTTALSIETTGKNQNNPDKLPRREKPHHLTEPDTNLFKELHFPASLEISFAPADRGIFTCFISEVH